MADRSNDIPAPAEAQSVVHAKYHEVQIAQREAEMSQLRLQLAEAEYRDQLRQQEIAAIQNEKDALHDKNNALLDKNNTLRVENIALQEWNSALRVENTDLEIENTNLQALFDNPVGTIQAKNNGVKEEEEEALGFQVSYPS